MALERSPERILFEGSWSAMYDMARSAYSAGRFRYIEPFYMVVWTKFARPDINGFESPLKRIYVGGATIGSQV